jgi:hypothetical protein
MRFPIGDHNTDRMLNPSLGVKLNSLGYTPYRCHVFYLRTSKILSIRNSTSLILFLSLSWLTANGACRLRWLDNVFERWWVLVRRWSRDQCGGKRSDREFFIRARPLCSPRLSPVAHELCVQHRGQKERQDNANADTDDESGVVAVVSIPIPDRGLMMLSQSKPSRCESQ